MRIEFIFNHNDDLKDSVFDINEDEAKSKAEITFNLTNLVENVETGAGLDVLKNVIEDWRWNEHNLLLGMSLQFFLL